ncbi:MAG: hypothetical protein ACRCZF_19345, partial [Gemmataceae bacterium]
MRRRRRLILGLFFTLAGLLLLVWFGFNTVVNSDWARQRVATELSARLQMPVTVTALQTLPNSTELSLALGEFVTLEHLTLDQSAWSLARGASVGEVRARGVTVRLKITADEKLLTQVPKLAGGGESPPTLPVIVLDDATIIVEQGGKPTFRMANITATVREGRIQGTVRDPSWGVWTLDGELDLAAGGFTVHLRAPAAIAQFKNLQSIPFVPEDVWQHVVPEGASAAVVTLGIKNKKFLYEVNLDATEGSVGIPDLDCTLTKVRGKIRILDERVELLSCEGELAGGGVKARGILNFKPETKQLDLAIDTEGCDVTQLPRAWGLPAEITGKLVGHADLTIRVPKDGAIQPTGGGRGRIEGAKLAGLPATIRLQLRGDGRRLRFDRDEAAVAPPVKNRRQSPPAAVPVPSPPPAAAAPAVPGKPATDPTTLDASVTLDDVDLPELLKKLELQVPYRFGGKVTIRATLAVPVGTPEQRKSYSLRGSLRSAKLQFQDATLEDVRAEVRYADGKLTLSRLTAKVPGGGSVTGSGTVQVEPAGMIDADLKLDRVPLELALEAIPDFDLPIRGLITGEADFHAPLSTLGDPKTWLGSARLRSNMLTIFERHGTNCSGTVKMIRGEVFATNVKTTIENVPTQGEARLALTQPYAYTATATATPSATTFQALVPEIKLPFEIVGELQTQGKLTGTIQPFVLNAVGTARATNLTIGGATGQKLDFNWDITPERAILKDVVAEAFRGTIRGQSR